MRNRAKAAVVAASTVTVVALAGASQAVVQEHSDRMVPVTDGAGTGSGPAAERPLSNDCSGGHVTFTFDDGPGRNTPEVLDALDGLGIDAVFFWNGRAVEGRESTVARAVAEGHVIGNHSYSHPDLTTGVLPDGSEETVTAAWLRGELQRTDDALVAAGAPDPALYRPPYGAVDTRVDEVAQELGLRLVMPWGLRAEDNIVDTRDTEGVTTQQIIDTTTPRLRDGTIITMHDGQGQATLNSIAALQAIVDTMNERELCATADVRENATGRVLDTYG
ncbi:hypothetical protein AC792_04995 [Arthrobacter sp. RIT-PI-e]|uniref:polysaccharide deacetylase family protein n=1 Tax=Arthrobacter sp. RIT-PI-e TaxID=1681197 RepID=UPI000676AD1D|nr:polysaccharide deacetylase family protein [Arthrobacter sp. RIT-PI-e]KNC19729.1 hypothetical protein AC792_04995 [Arthrobacter sp. RIT-PI-e]